MTTKMDSSGITFPDATVQATRAIRSATLVVAASDAHSKAQADYVCDGTADENEINTALGNLPAVGGIVYLTEGTYNLAGAITVGDNQELILSPGAKLVPGSDFDVVVIQGGATLRGGNIDVSGLTSNFTSACIKIDGSEFNGWNEDRHTIIEDVWMLGYRNGGQAYGVALLFECPDGGQIYRVKTRNLYMQYFEYGYRLHTAGTGWINGNQNKDGVLAYVDYAFHLDRDGSAITGNVFRDFIVQAGSNSRRCIKLEGGCHSNIFDNIWPGDWAGYAAEKTVVEEAIGCSDNIYNLICEERYINTVGYTPLFDVYTHGYGSIVDTNSRRVMRGKHMRDLYVPEGCAFYLPMANDEGSAISSFSSPYGLVDLYNSPTWGTAKLGRGKLTFNGTTQYGKTRLAVFGGGYNSFGTDQTFIIVVKPSFNWDDNNKHVFFHTSRTGYTGFELSKTAGNKLCFRSWKSAAFDVSAEGEVQFSSGDSLVLIGSSKDDDTIYLYVNGQQVGTATPTETQETNASNFWFMSDQGPGNYAGGDLLYFAWLCGAGTDDYAITDTLVASHITQRLAVMLYLEDVLT